MLSLRLFIPSFYVLSDMLLAELMFLSIRLLFLVRYYSGCKVKTLLFQFYGHGRRVIYVYHVLLAFCKYYTFYPDQPAFAHTALQLFHTFFDSHVFVQPTYTVRISKLFAHNYMSYTRTAVHFAFFYQLWNLFVQVIISYYNIVQSTFSTFQLPETLGNVLFWYNQFSIPTRYGD
jgi:hypothetical protein